MKTDNMLDLIDQTNKGIYKALLTIDDEIATNTQNMFGNTAAYYAAFPTGIAEAYKEFMKKTIEPQITTPPKYLTNLWERTIGPFLLNSTKFGDV
ncbi:hypothetical protein DM02DRAFT_474912, partial [Periconia macrospinosa]